MGKGLLIGGSIVAGVFVGFIACRIIEKKYPKLLKTATKKASSIRKKTSKIAREAKQAFAEGFKGAHARVATA